MFFPEHPAAIQPTYAFYEFYAKRDVAYRVGSGEGHRTVLVAVVGAGLRGKGPRDTYRTECHAWKAKSRAV